MFENKACEVLKIRSLLFVNDWFQNKHNEVIGLYRQTLFNLYMNKLILAITIALFSLSGFAQPINVAMIKTTRGSDGITPMILNMVRAELETSITNEPGYSAFKRTEIDEMTKEINFQQSGMVDDNQLTELGKMSGADYVCLSKISITKGFNG